MAVRPVRHTRHTSNTRSAAAQQKDPKSMVHARVRVALLTFVLSYLYQDGRATPPPPPPQPNAFAGNAEAMVLWSPPTGNNVISRYKIVSEPPTYTLVVGPLARQGYATPLTNGVSYTFTVSACADGKWGEASVPSDTVTPSITNSLTSRIPSFSPLPQII